MKATPLVVKGVMYGYGDRRLVDVRSPAGAGVGPGDVQAFDVRTGRLKWTFHVIPRDSELGAETWQDGGHRYTGNANVWSMMSGDDELGMVYLPTTTPNSDYDGGHRKGDRLFAESIVAVNVETGQRVWHFQAVHHGVWDYDLPAAPTLLDIAVGGRRIKALAQVSKQAFTYVFDQATGRNPWFGDTAGRATGHTHDLTPSTAGSSWR